MTHDYYQDLPGKGDVLTYCGPNEELTKGFDYKVLNVQFEVVSAYEVLVETDPGHKAWILLNEFNWSK